MDFGKAIEALKDGKKVSRQGWNGKDMFIYLVKGRVVPVEDLKNEASFHYPLSKDVDVKVCDHIDMKAADGSIVVGWLASQTDMLSDDWGVLS